MPSFNVTLLFMNVGVSSMIAEPDMGATKSSGLRHLRSMTSHISSMLRVGDAEGELMARVWDW